MKYICHKMNIVIKFDEEEVWMWMKNLTYQVITNIKCIYVQLNQVQRQYYNKMIIHI